jgi:hypothetical protein
MSGLAAFTLLHVLISLVGIGAGLVCLGQMLGARLVRGWTHVFLLATLLTSVTGFFFPFVKLLPSHVTGIVSLIVLVPTLYGFYAARLAGRWRGVYVIGAVAALYLNCFVLVVQLFLKVPFLNAFAPTQSEPPFVAAQGALLLAMIGLGFLAFRRFHPA